MIRAEGEAEAAATISKALDRAGEAFVLFRRIEASKDIGKHNIYFDKPANLLTRSQCMCSILPFWIEERDISPGKQRKHAHAGAYLRGIGKAEM